MKIIFNETRTTVILNGGHLELSPKGAPHKKDRLSVSDRIAELPDVKRFVQAGKLTILSAHEAAQREIDELHYTAIAKAAIAEKARIEAEKAMTKAQYAKSAFERHKQKTIKPLVEKVSSTVADTAPPTLFASPPPAQPPVMSSVAPTAPAPIPMPFAELPPDVETKVITSSVKNTKFSRRNKH